jgi:peptidoglycan/LPS O-acetylase OafA/YrhL
LLLITAIPLAVTWESGSPRFDSIGAAWFSYAILVFALFHYLKAIDIGKVGNFSYGLYLYSFPVQQTLTYFFKDSMSGWLLVLYACAATLPLASLSWLVIEKPALQLKRPGTRPLHAQPST